LEVCLLTTFLAPFPPFPPYRKENKAIKSFDGSNVQVMEHSDPEKLPVRKSFIRGVYWLREGPSFQDIVAAIIQMSIKEVLTP